MVEDVMQDANGAVRVLDRHLVTGRGAVDRATHNSLIGGLYSIEGDVARELQAELVTNWTYGRTNPPITENRTERFPLYVDVDLKVPVPTLSHDAIEKIANVTCQRIALYYADNPDPSLIDCVACARDGEAKQVAGGNHKHGIHLHFPKLIVDFETVSHILPGIYAGLGFEDWKTELGVSTINWEEAVDRAVYGSDKRVSGGLRMLYCPKAELCSECKGAFRACGTCGGKNNRRVIDRRVYAFSMVVSRRPDGVYAKNDEMGVELCRNRTTIMRRTSVRTFSALTPHFKAYVGCPPPLDVSRKRRSQPATSNNETQVFDEEAKRAARQLLVKHSERYANSQFRIYHAPRRNCPDAFRIRLMGDGATFCLNKGEEHARNTVYMEVHKAERGGGYQCWMRCYCRCPVPRFGSNNTCRDYRSPPKPVEFMELNALRSTLKPACEPCEEKPVPTSFGAIEEEARRVASELVKRKREA